MKRVLRWGQSAYESDLDLGLERDGAEALGLTWTSAPESIEPPPLEGVDALVVTSRVRVNRSVLDRFDGSLVLTTTSGTDHLDLLSASDRGIAVGRCPLARRDPVVEHALAGLLGLLHRQPALHGAANQGRWARAELPRLAPISLRNAPVVVVGLGVIGRRMVEVLQALGADVWGHDPHLPPNVWPPGVRRVDLDGALPHCAAVTLHCSLTPTSRGLMNRERIAQLSPEAVLVNTARGALVDVAAACAAVREGHLRGVALDVFPAEPWPELANAAAIEGVWLTPHASGYDRELGQRVAREVVDALGAWVRGAPLPHPVEATWR